MTPEQPAEELPPGRPDDELVSAVLDGEATSEQRKRVDADPTLSARLQQFRATAEVMAQPPAGLADDQRDTLMTAALGAANPSTLTAPPVALAARRATRARRWPPVGLVAAAVLVLVALGAALILTGRGDHRSTSASRPTGIGGATNESANDQAGEPRRAAEAAPPSLGTGGATPLPPAAPSLGAFSNPDGLRAALKPLDPRTLQPVAAQAPVPDASTSATTTTASSTGGSSAVSEAQFRRCDGVVRANEAELGPPLAFAPARVEQRTVIVISYALAASADRVRQYAVDATSCVPLLAIDR